MMSRAMRSTRSALNLFRTVGSAEETRQRKPAQSRQRAAAAVDSVSGTMSKMEGTREEKSSANHERKYIFAMVKGSSIHLTPSRSEKVCTIVTNCSSMSEKKMNCERRGFERGHPSAAGSRARGVGWHPIDAHR